MRFGIVGCGVWSQTFNATRADYLVGVQDIELSIRERLSTLDPATVRFEYTGGDRGWKGDVPVVRLNCDRIQALGWQCELPAAAALEASIRAMFDQTDAELH